MKGQKAGPAGIDQKSSKKRKKAQKRTGRQGLEKGSKSEQREISRGVFERCREVQGVIREAGSGSAVRYLLGRSLPTKGATAVEIIDWTCAIVTREGSYVGNKHMDSA
jgi:hypothetical protein